MKPQIVHEAEIHRQHVRLRIPIVVEIDGTRYSASTTGRWAASASPGRSARASRASASRSALIFPFEDFELTLRLDAQMVYILPELPRFGGQFVRCRRASSSLFRYIVDAYLSGEIVSGGDILSVVARDQIGRGHGSRSCSTP